MLDYLVHNSHLFFRVFLTGWTSHIKSLLLTFGMIQQLQQTRASCTKVFHQRNLTFSIIIITNLMGYPGFLAEKNAFF